MTTLETLLRQSSPIIIDGGLSNVLEAKGCDLNHKLWTAKLIKENPEAIIQTHIDYIDAGAQIIATASYQASFPGLAKEGYNKKEGEELMLKSVDLASEAIERSAKPTPPLVAASLGPYGAYLADGSEYKGNYGVSKSELKTFHQERLSVFEDSEADLLAIETIPSYEEAKVLTDLLSTASLPAWVSFSCKDDNHLNDGTPLKDAVSLFKNHPTVFALGVNCTQPKYISGLIDVIKKAKTGKRILVYPNSGELYDPLTKSWQSLSEPIAFAEMCEKWIDQGADMIGGCCRIGPEHIQQIGKIKE